MISQTANNLRAIGLSAHSWREASISASAFVANCARTPLCWTFHLGSRTAGDAQGLLNLSKTAVIERAMLGLCRLCYSALH
jgi:hypothetical protein